MDGYYFICENKEPEATASGSLHYSIVVGYVTARSW